MSAEAIIARLGLQPHPEGGWYRQTWAGPEVQGRASGTAILFLLKAGERSHWHRVDADEIWLWPRVPPIRVRKTVPDGWIELTLREGRNRQVRRMCAAVGLPCLRLIRWRVGDWTLEGLSPGEWRQV